MLEEVQGALMPKETPTRWEGTHTYKKPEAEKRKARTVAQLREEAAAKSKAGRENAISKRRGSICPPAPSAAGRRGSTGGISAPPVTGEAEEEEFFDADEMPGSNKKKRQTSGREDEGMEVEKPSGVDPEMKALLMSIKTDINASTNTAFQRVDERIAANEATIQKVGRDTAEEIRKIKQHVDEAQAQLEKKLDEKIEKSSQRLEKRIEALESRGAKGVTPATSGRREAAFHKSRRSLKMWPIGGRDLVDGVRVFMRNKLGMDDQKIASIGELSVTRAVGKVAKEREEVLVVFEDRDTRDYVKSTGPSLAGDRRAGMALHVPGHLLDNFYALNSVGYNIKSNHTGVKRAVKFDDANMDLYLDICINEQWKRIRPAEAKEALKAAPSATSSNDRSLCVDHLTSLIQGEPVAGLTATVVVEEQEDQ